MYPATACTIRAARGMVLLRACAAVAELAVYCTGDWDEARQREHARTVTLLHPLADTP